MHILNIILWIVQGFLAAAFIIGGPIKIFSSKETLLPKYSWVEDFSTGQVKLIGLAEFSGGIGIILPRLLNVLPILSAAAGLGLALLMLGAVYTHIRRSEMAHSFGPLFLAVLAAFVAYGRFFLVK